MRMLPPRKRRIGADPHLCVDVRERTIHWARAIPRRGPMQLLDWGTIPRDTDRALEEQLGELATQEFAQGQKLEVSLRSTQLRHERSLLPAISLGEARQVAQRRSEDLARSMGDDTAVDYTIRRTNQFNAIWLAGVPECESTTLYDWWDGLGLPPQRLQSRHLALGQLVHFVGDVAEGEVVAIFDLEDDSGTCVLADRHGWVFGREVSLRFLGRTVEVEPEPWCERDEIELEGADSEPEATRGPASRRAELLATELRRTFRYVQGHLDSGPVSRIWLTGEIESIADLAPELAREIDLPVSLLANAQDADATELAAAAAAIGMAHAPDARCGNLLPAAVRQQLHEQRARRRLTWGMAAAAAVIALLGLGLVIQLGTLRSQVEEMEQDWAAAAVQRQHMLETKRARANAAAVEGALERIDDAAPSFTQLLQTLAHTIPDESSVHRLSAKRGDAGWEIALAVESAGETMAHAAQAVSDFARRVELAPFASIDRIERESTPAGADSTSGDHRVRFRLEGRLAPIEVIRAPGEGAGSDV